MSVNPPHHYLNPSHHGHYHNHLIAGFVEMHQGDIASTIVIIIIMLYVRGWQCLR